MDNGKNYIRTIGELAKEIGEIEDIQDFTVVVKEEDGYFKYIERVRFDFGERKVFLELY